MRGAQIEFDGSLYDSPSAASVALRRVQSWNGWTDWRYHGEKLAALRARLLARKRSDAESV